MAIVFTDHGTMASTPVVYTTFSPFHMFIMDDFGNAVTTIVDAVYENVVSNFDTTQFWRA